MLFLDSANLISDSGWNVRAGWMTVMRMADLGVPVVTDTPIAQAVRGVVGCADGVQRGGRVYRVFSSLFLIRTALTQHTKGSRKPERLLELLP